MPDAWRIDGAHRAAQSFNGAGAALAGGRWNPTGVRVVYASQHLATACLEKFIHLPKPVPAAMRFVQFEIEFNGVTIERPKRAALPANWRQEPVPESTQEFGLEWFRSGRTAVLAIPSAIIPEEENYVLNPAHPDFAKLTLSKPKRFEYDARLATLKR
jgi:RES domain-containing protein